MHKADLAGELRARQHAFGQVSPAMIEALSDDAIIDCYITCSCCGEKQVNAQQLLVAIRRATDADGFFTVCEQLGRRHR